MTEFLEARLIGGPMDGSVVEIKRDAERIEITMADATRHRYRATSFGDGEAAFTYEGRF